MNARWTMLVVGALVVASATTVRAGPARPARASPRPAAATTYVIETLEVRAQATIATTIRARPADVAAAVTPNVIKLLLTAQERNLEVAGPPFVRYLSRANAKELVVEVGLPLTQRPSGVKLPDQVRADTLPAGPVARVIHRGRHEHLVRAQAALDAWLVRNRRTTSGPGWTTFVTNPITTPSPDDQVTHLLVPLVPLVAAD